MHLYVLLFQVLSTVLEEYQYKEGSQLEIELRD